MGTASPTHPCITSRTKRTTRLLSGVRRTGPTAPSIICSRALSKARLSVSAGQFCISAWLAEEKATCTKLAAKYQLSAGERIRQLEKNAWNKLRRIGGPKESLLVHLSRGQPKDPSGLPFLLILLQLLGDKPHNPPSQT